MSRDLAEALTSSSSPLGTPAIRESFAAEMEAAIGAEVDLKVTIKDMVLAQDSRRRVQATDDESVTINYVVKCGADGCLDEKDALLNMVRTCTTPGWPAGSSILWS